VATWLARRHGLRLYSADTRTWIHRDRALAAGNLAAHRWESMSLAERWEQSTPAEMLSMSLHAERGHMVVEDLRALPQSPLVIAEGSTLPASVVSAGIAQPSRAVWLIPTPAFQREELAARGTLTGHARLYLLLRAVIEREAIEHGAPIVTVDGRHSIAELARHVERLFRDAIDEGPRAETIQGRQALLREINEAIAAQVRGYYARPWAEGDPDSAFQSFVCECGDVACQLSVNLTVGAATAANVLVAGHSN
jgi:hypothetical protein